MSIHNDENLLKVTAKPAAIPCVEDTDEQNDEGDDDVVVKRFGGTLQLLTARTGPAARTIRTVHPVDVDQLWIADV